MNKKRIAIIGPGKIGSDLLAKVHKNPLLECLAFVGRRNDSEGVMFSKSLGVPTFTTGYEALTCREGSLDWIIDATNAESHRQNITFLQQLGAKIIDLTPSGLGRPFSPLIDVLSEDDDHLNLMTCGAQVSLPFVTAVNKLSEVVYTESIASLSSDSVGIATRNNIDDYIETTEIALRRCSGGGASKAILIINPARPPVTMIVTIYIRLGQTNLRGAFEGELSKSLSEALLNFKTMVPGIGFQTNPKVDENLITINLRVVGSGDYIPKHSGNLDVLTAAAISVIEKNIQRIG